MKRIGIIGGGQLARMMIYESRKFGFHFTVLDPGEFPPARPCADRFIQGGLYDEKALRELVESSDVSTYDIEHIDTEILKVLEDEGHNIEPSPSTLAVIQDKFVQKERFTRAELPVSRYTALRSPGDIDTVDIDYPFVQKARTGGYDGRGVAVIRGPEDLGGLLDCPSIIEEFIPFEKELAVMVARGKTGETRSYPVVEMTFDAGTNICSEVIAPARIGFQTAMRARELAERAVNALGGAGVYGVELFLTENNDIFINEAAPRPHNSGHYTIEACRTSQFEQHIRAVAGLPLGDTGLHHAAVMVNLLGGSGTGKAVYRGLEEALKEQGCSVHLYGKTESRPNRKMGHATCIGENIEELIQRAERVRQLIKITGETDG